MDTRNYAMPKIILTNIKKNISFFSSSREINAVNKAKY